MMTGYYSRKHLPRTPYSSCPKRPPLWNNPLYYFRSPILYRIFLSILPFKPRPHSRTRRLLTPNRHSSTKSPRSPTAQHLCPIGLRSFYYLSPSQFNRRRPKPYITSPIYHHHIRNLLYTTASLRVL